MAELLEMPFRMLNGVGPRKPEPDGQQIPMGNGNYLGKGVAHCKV